MNDPMIRNPTIMVERHRRPISQSKYISSAIIAMGVVIATVRSGTMCSRKLSIDAVESIMIFRILPLPSVSMYPSGRRITFDIQLLRMLATVRNPPTCEHPNAQKYTHMALIAYFTAVIPYSSMLVAFE